MWPVATNMDASNVPAIVLLVGKPIEQGVIFSAGIIGDQAGLLLRRFDSNWFRLGKVLTGDRIQVLSFALHQKTLRCGDGWLMCTFKVREEKEAALSWPSYWWRFSEVSIPSSNSPGCGGSAASSKYFLLSESLSSERMPESRIDKQIKVSCSS